MRRSEGVTLLELLCVMAIAALLLALAAPAYQQFMARGRLAEARAALLENNHYMQRWYAERGVYHQEQPWAWPPLPVTSTQDFDIAFSTAAPSSDNVEQASFLIEARPRAGSHFQGQLLRLDQDGNIRHCRLVDGGEHCEG
ncbi:pilus assembly protein PilE [Xenophilus sp. AP218F]|nr:type IV pilin protein [Chromobacterium sp. ASV5]OWY37445.1 pilus assembly protein PilE [Xenophilus sp. AP218F]